MRKQGIALVAALSVCILAACADETIAVEPEPDVIATEAELQDDMRELWTAHVVWTRVVVIASLAGSPEAPDATQRLLRNQDEIADAIRPFYGDAAANELARLLREHITIALDVVYGASAGVGAEAAIDAWFANADDIARFLASANPNWSYEELSVLMRAHLDYTIVEVASRLGGDWEAEVVAFDEVLTHALHMADVLTDGIAAQFPERIAPSDQLARERQLELAQRELWQEHVIWTRMYIMSAGQPEASFAAERLLRNQDELGDAMRPFYGDAAGDELTRLMREHITLAVDVVYAASIDDGPGTQAAIAVWFENANEIARFLSDANPNLRFEDVKAMMDEHLDQTIVEATARLAGDWARDIAAYDAIVLHVLHLADTLSEAIAAQFPGQVR